MMLNRLTIISSLSRSFGRFQQSKRFVSGLSDICAGRRKEIMESNTKIREDPVVTKLDNDLFKSIFSEELHGLLNIFKKNNYEIRIAGGAVRDLLMDVKPVDLDFATTATPSQMKKMFEEESIRMLNTNGEKHGTITVRINDKENFECTTLRIDVLTDGRHAKVVQFTEDWLLDANRRDLTINAMFLGFDGSIYDYFYGYEDLKARKVQFVGNADTRIKEDFLRILRYFRFYGKIATIPDNHDHETLMTIAKNAEGLQKISGERIWVELRKILLGNFAGELMTTLVECGISKYIGLPENPNIDDLQRLWKNNKSLDLDCHPVTLLSSLLHTPEDSIRLHERLKFSTHERDLTYFISQFKNTTKDDDALMTYQQLCLQPAMGKYINAKIFVEELLKFHGKSELYKELKNWEIPKFPINGMMLMQQNCPEGKLMGVVMRKLKAEWIRSEFKATSDELIACVPKIFEELNIVDGKQMKKPKTN